LDVPAPRSHCVRLPVILSYAFTTTPRTDHTLVSSFLLPSFFYPISILHSLPHVSSIPRVTCLRAKTSARRSRSPRRRHNQSHQHRPYLLPDWSPPENTTISSLLQTLARECSRVINPQGGLEQEEAALRRISLSLFLFFSSGVTPRLLHIPSSSPRLPFRSSLTVPPCQLTQRFPPPCFPPNLRSRRAGASRPSSVRSCLWATWPL